MNFTYKTFAARALFALAIICSGLLSRDALASTEIRRNVENRPDLATAVPEAPTNLRGDSYSATEILLLWSDNATNENGFEIQYRRQGDRTWITRRVGPSTFWADVTGLAPGCLYEFRLRATGQTSHSDYTDPIVLRTCSGLIAGH